MLVCSLPFPLALPMIHSDLRVTARRGLGLGKASGRASPPAALQEPLVQDLPCWYDVKVSGRRADAPAAHTNPRASCVRWVAYPARRSTGALCGEERKERVLRGMPRLFRAHHHLTLSPPPPLKLHLPGLIPYLISTRVRRTGEKIPSEPAVWLCADPRTCVNSASAKEENHVNTRRS